MSLENAILALAEAINNHAAAVRGGGNASITTGDCAPAVVAPAPEKPKAEKPKAETKAEKPKAETKAEVALDYAKDVRPVVIAFGASYGTDKAMALLSKLGVKSAKELKPEQYQACIDLFTEAQSEES